MSLDTHVDVQIKINSTGGVTRLGFGTIAMPSYKGALFGNAKSLTFARLSDAIAAGFPADSAEGQFLSRVFAQSPRVKTAKLLKCANAPTLAFALALVEAGLFTYAANIAGETVTPTEISYTGLADLDFVDADVTVGTDTIHEVGHGMVTGQSICRLKNVGGALPTGLAADTDVWPIRVDDDNYKLATTKANALAGVAIDITAAAGGGVHTLLRQANDVIIANLVDQAQAVVGKNYTAVQVPGAGDTDTMTFTGDAAGDFFTIEVLDSSKLKITTTTADPGIVADLTAAAIADPDWYWLYTSNPSKAIVDVVDAWIEATPFKVYVPDTSDGDVENTAPAGATDVAAETAAKVLKSTHLIFHRKPAEMVGAGVAAVVAWRNPGSWTLAYQTIVGATADDFTATQFVNLDGKRCSYYKAEGGVPFVWEGMVGNLDYGFLDVKVALDFVLDGLQKAGFSYLKARSVAGKVAYTDADIRGLISALESFIKLCTTDQYKLVAPGTPGDPNDPEPTVTVPSVADIEATSPASIVARDLPNIEVNFRLQTAVHTVGVTVNVSK